MADGMASSAVATGVPPASNGAPASAWDGLAATDDTAFQQAWLQLQCTHTTGARAGVVLRVNGTELLPVAAWPPRDRPVVELIRVAERAAAIGREVIAWAKRPATGALDLLIAQPVRAGGAVTAVLAIACDVPGGIETADPDAVAERLRLGAGWAEARAQRQFGETSAARAERVAVALDVVAVASAQKRLNRAAVAVANELAIRLRCDRVAIGLVRRKGVKLLALSHAASFQERNRIVDAIENAMEECLAQTVAVDYPARDDGKQGRIAVAHRDLAALEAEPTAAASFILPGPKGPAGVVTIERHGGVPFDRETLLLAEATSDLLGPVLAMHAANHRLIAGRGIDTLRDGVETLVGPDRPALKLGAIAAAAAVLFLCVATGEYRVTARAVLEGEVQRAAVAPFDGFIAAAPARPGDRIAAGDLLAAMDDRDLTLDRARAWADTERLRQKYSEAMAKHDRATSAMIAAQIDQADAQLALATDKLKRTRIVAPISGQVVSGDLSQLLGSPVEKGKLLFEIAPLDQYRVIIRADERDLRFLSPGQHGQLALSGMPSDRQTFTVNRVTPIAEARDGRNEFRIEAVLDDPPSARLRPGMEGVAKIETGSHHLVWVWTHGLIDWLRLTAWKWMP